MNQIRTKLTAFLRLHADHHHENTRAQAAAGRSLGTSWCSPARGRSGLLVFTVLFGSMWLLTASAGATEPTGRWKGRWSSGTTGHSGPMRARVTPNSDGSYSARFAGRFFVVIPFVYRAELQPVQTWAGTTYVVDKKLGPLLGSYRMNAIIPGNEFCANFSAAGDTGQIQMRRLSY